MVVKKCEKCGKGHSTGSLNILDKEKGSYLDVCIDCWAKSKKLTVEGKKARRKAKK